jgi:uncharacterized repeat protein (TIGR03803 family)
MELRSIVGAYVVLMEVALTSIPAQTYSVIKEFNGSDGQGPVAPLVLSGNNFYGTTYLGGNSNWGTIFSIKTDGASFSTLRHFAGPTHTNGALPTANLILSGNTLFGTTEAGGLSSGSGTIFRINTNGSGYTAIRPFGISNENHVRPRGGLLLVNNTLFGTTYGKPTPTGYGTVFRVATNGAGFSAIMDLGLFPLPGDGRNPYTSLIASGPFLFGTTYNGGNSGCGTVFRVATNGTSIVFIKHFTGGDGANPRTPLLLAANTLYGMTFNGGAAALGTIYKKNTNGTGYSVLKHFSGSDGSSPLGSLLLIKQLPLRHDLLRWRFRSRHALSDPHHWIGLRGHQVYQRTGRRESQWRPDSLWQQPLRRHVCRW